MSTITTNHALFGFIAAVTLFSAVMVSLQFAQQAHADASNVVPATVATTSNPTVNTTAALVFATSTCVSRTISTVASPIMITFTDNQGKVPSATFGFLQAASTTATYDASQFGCGAVKIYSFASSNITVQEAR